MRNCWTRLVAVFTSKQQAVFLTFTRSCLPVVLLTCTLGTAAHAELSLAMPGSAPATGTDVLSISGSVDCSIVISPGSRNARARMGAADNSQTPTAAKTSTTYPTTPFITPASGTYTAARTITITDATPGSTIYYTTDGSTPTTASPAYSGSFSTLGTPSTETVRAVAVLHGVSGSATSAVYTIAPRMDPPVFAPAQGTYMGTQSITLSAEPGQTIHYTTDGSMPTISSPVYRGAAIAANPGRTKVAAIVEPTSGYVQSVVVAQTYTVVPATPYILPASGTYTTARSVTMGDSTAAATIYYTTDGSAPTTSSRVYTGAFTTPATPVTETVRTFAVAGGVYSSAVSATYTIAPAMAAPTFSPKTGSFLTAQKVTLTAPTAGETIYYTTDGTAPTTNSAVYSGTPIPVTIGRVVIAAMIPAATGYSQSVPVSQTYTMLPASPWILPSSGTYTKSRAVTIGDSSVGATIYYTTDGSVPTTASSVYTGSFPTPSTSTSETVRAIAVLQGVTGSTATATYTIAPAMAAPTFSPKTGSYLTAKNITLTAPIAGETIYYTTDGTKPTTSSSVYSGTPIAVTIGRVVITAMIPAATGYSQSVPAAQTYTMLPATPWILPAAGTYTTSRTVTMGDSSPGATIYYTTDGSAPTTSSAIYTGGFSTPATSATETVRAMAVRQEVSGSIAAATYTIAPLPVTPAPSITPVTGTYSTAQVVSMNDSLAGAAIFYTLDGSTPTGASTRYTGPFSFATSQTGTYVVKAIASKTKYHRSAIVEADVTLGLPEGVIASTTVGATPVDIIATDFLGLGHNWGVAEIMMGDAAGGVNSIYRTLIGTLANEMNGPIQLRIGGFGTDTSGQATAATVEPFVELAQAENVIFTLGVNLGSDDLDLAEEQAQVFVANMPSKALAALEIGNEPDGFVDRGLRPSTYGYADFLPEYQRWFNGVSSVAPSVPIAGPSFGTGYWIANAEADVADSALQASVLTQHKYIACYDPKNPFPNDFLLQPTSSTASMWALQPYAATAKQKNIPLRMNEINSICSGGQMGLSNSFSSALWAVDNMFEYAKAGIEGVNWNTDGTGGPYDLFKFSTWNNGHTNQFSLKEVRPLYYGLSFFAQAAGNTAQLLPAATLTDANLKIWVTADSTGSAHLVIINKEQTTSGSVQITLPGYSKGSIVRLADSGGYLATKGVTLGGQTYDGSTDGTLQGVAATETTYPVDGMWTISVDAMSAVLVNLRP